MSLSVNVLEALGLPHADYLPLTAVRSLPSHSPSFAFEIDGLPAVVEAHAPGLFRLRIGTPPAKVRFPVLIRDEAVGEGVLEPIEGGWRVVQGDDALEVLSLPLRLRVLRKGVVVLESSLGSLPAVARSEQGAWLCSFALGADTPVYGMDERPGTLSRRDAVSTNRPLQRAPFEGPRGLPLVWSPVGWGVYVHTLGAVTVSAGNVDGQLALRIEDTVLDLFLFAAEPEAQFNQFTALTGRPIAPPLWALGTWIRYASASEAPQATMQVKRWREAGLPLDVVCFDGPPPWQPGSKLVLEWVGTQAPSADALSVGSGLSIGAPLPERAVRMLGDDDPRVSLAALRKHNIHVGYSESAQVPATGAAREELEDRLWLLGEGGDQIDLTHQDAYGTWRDRHKALLDEGVSFIWTRSAPLPADAEGRHGDAGIRLEQLQVGLQSRSLMEAAVAAHGPLESLVVADAATIFSARTSLLAELQPPATPDLDVAQAQAMLEAQLRSEVSTGSAGLVSCAQPSLLPPAHPLFLRALLRSVFSPHFHLTAPIAAALPDLPDATLQVVRIWLAFRQRMLPYLVGCFEESARNGLPVLRSMALSFPHDRVAHAFEHQYLLGPSLLVAPLLGPDDTITVYLPAGEAWWDLNTGWRYEGGQHLTLTCKALQYPVFGREGHMFCLGPMIHHYGEFNSARVLDEVWLFGMPLHNPTVMRNKIRVMQMQGSSYVKGLEGLRILASEGLEVKRRGAEVRISRAR